MPARLSNAQFKDNLEHFEQTHAGEQGWDYQSGAFNQCRGAAWDYKEGGPEGHFHSGDHTSIYRFSGWTGDPSRAHPEWLELRHSRTGQVATDSWKHYVGVTQTESGTYVVDYTATQFDEEADWPHVEPLEDYRKRWATMDPEPDDRNA